jgi:hypothetical protein
VTLADFTFEARAANNPARSHPDRDGYILEPSNVALRTYAYIEMWVKEKGSSLFQNDGQYDGAIRSTLLPPAQPPFRLLVASYEFVVQRVEDDGACGGREIVFDPNDDGLDPLSFVRLCFSDELLLFLGEGDTDVNALELARFAEREMPDFRVGETVVVSFYAMDD